jgi:DNA modification methylase
VDLIITDPPYLVNYRDRSGRSVTNDDNPEAVLSAFPEMYRVLKDGSYCILFCGWSEIAQFSKAWTDAGFRTVGKIVWRKSYASRVWHTQCHHESAFLLAKGRPAKPYAPVSDVQEWTYSGNKVHPTEKAVEILTPLVRAYSQPGAIVLDPFSGSGSTSVAAAFEGRRYIGIEIEERYCVSARKRLAGASRYRQRKAA